MQEKPTPVEMLMAEVAANVEALVNHALESVAKPPRGSMAEVGHYKVLNERLKRKEFEALDRLLEELAYNVTATIFATIDGEIESDFPDFPRLAIVERGGDQPISDNLHGAFDDMWSEEDEPMPHPD